MKEVITVIATITVTHSKQTNDASWIDFHFKSSNTSHNISISDVIVVSRLY